jgi:NAD(P)H-hydrate epimerase
MYLVTADEMREMDRRTIESYGVPGRVLMENAGLGATRVFCKQFSDLEGKRIGVVAGRGNNGGDGFVIARYLAFKGIRVKVYLLSERSRVKGDAKANLSLLEPLNIPVIQMPDRASFSSNITDMRHQDLWIDAILGTGLQSDVKGYFRDVIDFINSLNKPVFSVDIASGLDSDTGRPRGVCIRAAGTATFAFAKPGHVLYPGATYSGNLEIVEIGIPPHIADAVGPGQHLLTRESVRSYFEPRPPESHKGDTGHLMVIAGSPGKTGAAAMTAESAMRTGAGLVTLGIPRSLNLILETQVLEAMTLPLPETVDGLLDESALDAVLDQLAGKKCMAIGPGLGLSDSTTALVHQLVMESTVPLVIDADGLNSLAGHTRLLKNLDIPVILTPHPGEMSRLVDASVLEVQKDRIGCARAFAQRYGVHVILKGARTIISHPDGDAFINPSGNPGMASGGMGDVLTGMIAGLVAQGYSPRKASHAAVYLHGDTADALMRRAGPFGYLASDVMEAIPGCIRDLTGEGDGPENVGGGN